MSPVFGRGAGGAGVSLPGIRAHPGGIRPFIGRPVAGTVLAVREEGFSPVWRRKTFSKEIRNVPDR